MAAARTTISLDAMIMAAPKVPADLDAWLSKNDQRIFDELNEFLRIPSVSARSEHDADTRRAAAWLHEKLAKIGFATETIPTAGHPVVLGGVAQGASRRADHSRVRPLRRAAARAARALDIARVRAPGPRRQALRARLGGRQGPALASRQGARGAPRHARDASGERRRDRRGRGGDRERAPRARSSSSMPRGSPATPW